MKKLLGKIVTIVALFSISYLYGFNDAVKDLLDDKDSYPTTAFELSNIIFYIYGFLFFIAGFIVSKLDILKYIKTKKSNIDQLDIKIKNTKDEKELLKILLSLDEDKYKPYIQILEESIYGEKKCEFSNLKEKLLEV